jgi:hypothetical protein
VLTLFFRSRAAKWRAGGAGFFPQVVVPALPLAALMGGMTVLFGAHGALWPTIVASESGHQTAPLAVLRQLGGYSGRPALGVATPLVLVILLFLALGALQIFYLDRLVITTGPADEVDTPSGPLPAAHAPWPAPGHGPPPPGPYGLPPGAYGPPPGPYAPPPGAYGPPPGGYGPAPAPAGPYGPPGGPGGYPPPYGHRPPPPAPPGDDTGRPASTTDGPEDVRAAPPAPEPAERDGEEPDRPR